MAGSAWMEGLVLIMSTSRVGRMMREARADPRCWGRWCVHTRHGLARLCLATVTAHRRAEFALPVPVHSSIRELLQLSRIRTPLVVGVCVHTPLL
jgi:hypothetical protein